MEITTCKPELTSHKLKLRFFDVEACLESDSKDFINIFEGMYHHFCGNGPSLPGRHLVNCAVFTRPDNPWQQPVMVVDELVWPLQNPDSLTKYVYDNILLAILAKVRTHFLIHAGAVAHNGQGIILAADSFHGKTTLVLELIRRGFEFLSDETAALGRADGCLHPFPRRLSVRPETWSLTGLSKANGKSVGFDKLLLDIGQVHPGRMGHTVDLNHIIILRDPDNTGQGQSDESVDELRVLVDRVDDAFLAAIRQIRELTELQVDTAYKFPLLRLKVARRMSVFTQLEALCQQRQILILNVTTGAHRRPTFQNPARLEAIPKSQAVLELLRRFQGGHKSALLQDEFGGNSTRLFMELASIIDQANCYQLFVGPLPEVAGLVCGLVNSSEGDVGR